MVLVECEFNWKAVGIVLQSFSCAVISCFCARARALERIESDCISRVGQQIPKGDQDSG